MTTLQTTWCPGCGFQGRIPEKYQGKMVECRRCRKRFVATAPPMATMQSAWLETENQSRQQDDLEEVAAQVLMELDTAGREYSHHSSRRG